MCVLYLEKCTGLACLRLCTPLSEKWSKCLGVLLEAVHTPVGGVKSPKEALCTV